MKTPSSRLTFSPFGVLKDLKIGEKKPASGLKNKNKKAIQPAKKTAEDFRTDEEVFLDAMSGVREIKEFRDMDAPRASRAKMPPGRRRPDNSMDALKKIVEGKEGIDLTQTAEYIEWTSPRTGRRDLARRLHAGEFAVQETIYLHGFTAPEAEEAVRDFLHGAMRNRLFCVKVIHGRGLRSPNGPVLKESVRRLLEGPFKKRIWAYSTAKGSDGGLGATYILLRSGKKG